jgi:hypothetical protein
MATELHTHIYLAATILQDLTDIFKTFPAPANPKTVDSLNHRKAAYNLYHHLLITLTRSGHNIEPVQSKLEERYHALIQAIHTTHSTHQTNPISEPPQ